MSHFNFNVMLAAFATWRWNNEVNAITAITTDPNAYRARQRTALLLGIRVLVRLVRFWSVWSGFRFVEF
jgi:hypothetical protein